MSEGVGRTGGGGLDRIGDFAHEAGSGPANGRPAHVDDRASQRELHERARFSERDRGEVPDDIAGQAIDELYEDVQSGDVLACGGFAPQQLARHYMQMVSGGEAGERTAARIDELADKLVDRMLVSHGSDRTPEQMQMKLVGEVFDGAEVFMRRERGELRLDFKTDSERSRDFLARHGDRLAAALTERLKEPVRVDVGEARPS